MARNDSFAVLAPFQKRLPRIDPQPVGGLLGTVTLEASSGQNRADSRLEKCLCIGRLVLRESRHGSEANSDENQKPHRQFLASTRKTPVSGLGETIDSITIASSNFHPGFLRAEEACILSAGVVPTGPVPVEK
jgi:hypothetical protein